MGGDIYIYFVPYQPDLRGALEELRQREFKAGRYYPATEDLEFPPDLDAESPGAQHTSIEEAMEDAGADGTRSILDLSDISKQAEFNSAAPLPDGVLKGLFHTTKPTRAMVEANDEFLEHVDRGQGIYIVLYKDDLPDELYFAGLSFD
jgi:hypothetical protein